jgi:ferric-dicitrate binding protein FerR (iron transport regulator)
MSDDLERRLEAFYRALDPSASRLQSRWKSRAHPVSTGRTRMMMAGGAVAAVAAGLLLGLWLRRPDSEPPGPRPGLARPAPLAPAVFPAPPPAPGPDRPEDLPAEPRRPVPPRVETPPEAPVPAPELRKPETPPSLPAPALPQEPKKAEPRPTLVERAVATLRETDGTFDLGDKAVRGRQKELLVSAGDRLRATSVVRLTLAEDRFILLSPRSVVEFRPEEKRLTIAIDLGDLHAELIGSGPEVRVVTKACEVQPQGTVFSVRAEEKKATVVVERGRVEVRGAKGKSAVRAGESVLATDDGAVTAPFAADFRPFVWMKSHRPPESTLFLEEFSRPGVWQAEVDKGVARAIPGSGVAGVVHLESEKPIFEVPVRGQIQVVYRADHASKMYIQFFVRDVRANFRKEVQVLRSPAWKTLTVDLDDCLPFDKSRPQGRAPAGASVHDLGLYYGEEGEKGNLWVHSIKVVEVRP